MHKCYIVLLLCSTLPPISQHIVVCQSKKSIYCGFFIYNQSAPSPHEGIFAGLGLSCIAGAGDDWFCVESFAVE